MILLNEIFSAYAANIIKFGITNASDIFCHILPQALN